MINNLNYDQVDNILAKYQDFFTRKVMLLLETFWSERQAKNDQNLKVKNAPKATINIADDYLKKSILDLENKTSIDYKEVKEIGKLLGKNIFELTSPHYISSEVAKILKLTSKAKVTEIVNLSNMFDNPYLVKRIKRVAKNDISKHETTVIFSILGILYLGYWLKNGGDLETYYVFSNPKIREDIKSSLAEYEKGNYKVYKTKADLQKLFN